MAINGDLLSERHLFFFPYITQILSADERGYLSDIEECF
ncbi:Hypothetical protein ETEE_2375 [Edwardsiella anguillarum ET080813]|uniref:Uncharacterized protein n=1 Tax=Edwardsiella anguillarum ET080813 TaxID=667120 RepID=A0A076LQ49_9GAMM|nr:Hypothetical protein ETEE_2375 [Edwardsiella anguillarum ET080813]